MTTSSMGASPSQREGRRVFGPGARRVVAAAVLAAGIAAAIVLLSSGGSHQSYGSLPSWLPKSARALVKNPAPPVERASPAHPILSEQQGYPVQVELPGGSASVTISGPEFPSYITNYAQNNLWSSTRLVPSTFLVTVTHVTGTVPLTASSFSTLTSLGKIERARLAMSGHAVVPHAIHAGQTVTVEVKTSSVEGQGSIRWAPLGHQVLAAWMYQLELD